MPTLHLANLTSRVPFYKLLRSMGLLNTYAAMFVPGAAFLVPTGIWLLKSYLEKIPIELEESAWSTRSHPFGNTQYGNKFHAS